MRPMRCLARRLFTLCSGLSLLLCVAVCVVWVRSYWATDFVWRGEPGAEDAGLIYTDEGAATFAAGRPTVADGPWRHFASDPVRARTAQLGVTWLDGNSSRV